MRGNERIHAVGGQVAGALRSPRLWIFLGVWVLTRAMIVANVGFWHDGPIEFEDVFRYEDWSNEIVEMGALPATDTWQYPPGAAAVMLIPRLSGGEFPESFIVMMLLFDLVGLGLIASFGRREERDAGVWVWLLGMPALYAFPILRFDLVPTVIAMAALLALARRPLWFGALAGIGATIKVWPILVLFGEWDRRRLSRALAAAVAACLAVLIASTIAFGDSSGFLGEQSGRGLQMESVAALPWYVRDLVTGEAVPQMVRYGSYEIPSAAADTVADLLKFASLLALAAAAAWWWGRDRAIRAGRSDLANAATGYDFVFAIVLVLVVVSRVLSPQFMIWLLGLAAFVLCSRDSRLRVPAWIVFGATFVPALSSTQGTILRNSALLVAAAYSVWTLAMALRDVKPCRR